MSSTTKIPDRAPSASANLQKQIKKYLPEKAYFILVAVLVLLSAIVCFDFSPKPTQVLEGEIAPSDIYAGVPFLFEDKDATLQKREQVAKLQPLLCEIAESPIPRLQKALEDIFMQASVAKSEGQLENLQKRLSVEWQEDLAPDVVEAFAMPAVQSLAMVKIVPGIEPYLKAGVLPDLSHLKDFNGLVGIHVRQTSSSSAPLPEDFVIREASGLYDITELKSTVVHMIQEIPDITDVEKKALGQLFLFVLEPSILPNFELTNERMAALRESIEPVIQRIQKGEILVRQGEKVTRDQQLKVQAFTEKKNNRFDASLFLGLASSGILLSFGLLFSPSAAKGNPMQRRDFIFIASLVVFFVLLAKGLFLLGALISESVPTFDPKTLAYAVPVAGAAGLSGLIFTTRRYLVTGLLLAFYCCMVFSGGVGLFLYYFLGAMWGTWLIARSYTRQEMFINILPLTAGLVLLWFGSTFVEGGLSSRYLGELLATVGSGMLSLLVLFSIAPVLELVFNYTTRFRLMELLNLEQPLLQDLMLNAPGTYHHSLIVANMVEAGAKSIGAHSLICKVAALYHDIGKISKANYFIENQLGTENPHEQLSPPMSALILISHTKHGAEIAEQNHLSKEICDIIKQHHGTGLIRYFYQKALHIGGTPPKIEDFCYPGPKPQTREAGIVMLADAVEASSRTLVNPTPHRLKAHIETVIRNINADGQLDETDLTFKDLSKVADSFNKILRGIFHHRIVYPNQENEKGSTAAKVTPAPAQDAAPRNQTTVMRGHIKVVQKVQG